MWRDRLQRATSEEALCRALRTVPVANGIVTYDALSTTLRVTEEAYPTVAEVRRVVHAVQARHPELWTSTCMHEWRDLLQRLGCKPTIREWSSK